MFNNKTKKEEVYSSTNLSDLLSSPIFYSVIALSFILGISSIFGFFNNPRKLKTVVDVISQKVLISPNSNTAAFNADTEYLLQNYSAKALVNRKGLQLEVTNSPYTIFSKYSVVGSVPTIDDNVNNKLQRASFEYDITSKQFWSGLDASQIESMIEEDLRRNGSSIMGAPLSSEYSLEQGDEKYSVNTGLLRL